MSNWNKPTENSVIRSIFTYLQTLDRCFAWKNHGGRFGVAGLPDIMMLFYSEPAEQLMFFAFEVKRPGTALKKIPDDLYDKARWKKQGATEIQAEVLEQIETAGGRSYVVENVNQVREIIEQHR